MADHLNIHQRLNAAMGEVKYVQKERKQGMRYTIVSHDAVTALVRPVLVAKGITYYPVAMTRSQNGNRTEVDLTVRFTNMDEPGDYIDVVACGYGVDDQDKGPGKAISYAVKYCLLKALGLETGDDPEEVQDESANHRPEPQKTNGTSHSPAASADSAIKIGQDFFARESYEIRISDRFPASKWDAAFSAAIAACMNEDALTKLVDDNVRQRTAWEKSANPAVVESVRQKLEARTRELLPGFKP